MTERAGAPAPGAPEHPGPYVVATAGHVDHGKSSLVTRLTGMDPDRLEEEKRRGLTIELGYACDRDGPRLFRGGEVLGSDD